MTTTNERIIITDPNKDRYNSFSLIPWWDQECLKKSKVAVLGAGAVGNEVLKNLALMGVGNIFIADFDIVQKTNLSKSVLFRPSDEGMNKAAVAARAVKDINPDTKTQIFDNDIINQLGLGILRRMDIIISCVDGIEARLAINQACWKVGKPWVDGAMENLYGIVRVFWPGKGACYECTLFPQDYELLRERRSCQWLAVEAYSEGRVPTTPTMASILGGIEVQEALKILHEINGVSQNQFKSNAGKALIIDGINNEVGWNTYSVKPDCQSHWMYDPIIELDEISSNTSTICDLISSIRERIHDQFTVELDFNFIKEISCNRCGRHELVLMPDYHMTYERSVCCNEVMDIESTFELTGEESFADMKLSEIGIPPLHIVRIKVDQLYLYAELSGDKNEIIIF